MVFWYKNYCGLYLDIVFGLQSQLRSQLFDIWLVHSLDQCGGVFVLRRCINRCTTQVLVILPSCNEEYAVWRIVMTVYKACSRRMLTKLLTIYVSVFLRQKRRVVFLVFGRERDVSLECRGCCFPTWFLCHSFYRVVRLLVHAATVEEGRFLLGSTNGALAFAFNGWLKVFEHSCGWKQFLR